MDNKNLDLVWNEVSFTYGEEITISNSSIIWKWTPFDFSPSIKEVENSNWNLPEWEERKVDFKEELIDYRLKTWDVLTFISEKKWDSWEKILLFVRESKEHRYKKYIEINSEDLQNQEHPVVQEIRDDFADTKEKIVWGQDYLLV